MGTIFDNVEKELTTQEVKDMVDVLYDGGARVMTVTGGEPLVRKDISEILKYIHEKGMKICLYTSGVPFLDQSTGELDPNGLIKEVISNIDFIGISLDLYHKQSYDRLFKTLKKKTTYEDFVRNIFSYIHQVRPELVTQVISVVGKHRSNHDSLEFINTEKHYEYMNSKQLVAEFVRLGNLLQEISEEAPNFTWKLNRFRYNEDMHPAQETLNLTDDSFENVVGEIQKAFPGFFGQRKAKVAPFRRDYSYVFIMPDGLIRTEENISNNEQYVDLGEFRGAVIHNRRKVWPLIRERVKNKFIALRRQDILLEIVRFEAGITDDMTPLERYERLNEYFDGINKKSKAQEDDKEFLLSVVKGEIQKLESEGVVCDAFIQRYKETGETSHPFLRLVEGKTRSELVQELKKVDVFPVSMDNNYNPYENDIQKLKKFFPFVTHFDEKEGKVKKGLQHTLRLLNALRLIRGSALDEYNQGYCAACVEKSLDAVSKKTFEQYSALLDSLIKGGYEELVYLTVFLHDIGEFINKEAHPELGAPIAESIMKELGLSKDLCRIGRWAIYNHVNVGTAFFGERSYLLLLERLDELNSKKEKEVALRLLTLLTLIDGDARMTEEKASGYLKMLNRREEYYDYYLAETQKDTPIRAGIDPVFAYRLLQFEGPLQAIDISMDDYYPKLRNGALIQRYEEIKWQHPGVIDIAENALGSNLSVMDYAIFLMRDIYQSGVFLPKNRESLQLVTSESIRDFSDEQRLQAADNLLKFLLIVGKIKNNCYDGVTRINFVKWFLFDLSELKRILSEISFTDINNARSPEKATVVVGKYTFAGSVVDGSLEIDWKNFITGKKELHESHESVLGAA